MNRSSAGSIPQHLPGGGCTEALITVGASSRLLSSHSICRASSNLLDFRDERRVLFTDASESNNRDQSDETPHGSQTLAASLDFTRPQRENGNSRLHTSFLGDLSPEGRRPDFWRLWPCDPQVRLRLHTQKTKGRRSWGFISLVTRAFKTAFSLTGSLFRAPMHACKAHRPCAYGDKSVNATDTKFLPGCRFRGVPTPATKGLTIVNRLLTIVNREKP